MTRRGNNFLGLSFVPSGMRHSSALPTCSTPWNWAPLVMFSGEASKWAIPQAAANCKSDGTRGICEMQFSSKAGGKQTFKLLPLLVQSWTQGSTCCIFISFLLMWEGPCHDSWRRGFCVQWLCSVLAVLQQQLQHSEMLLSVWPILSQTVLLR